MPTDLATILNLDVPVIVEIGRRRMTLDAIVALAPGSMVELPKTADDELDIRVNNVRIAQGQAVKVGENFGVRVTHVGATRQRVQAMAAAEHDPLDFI